METVSLRGFSFIVLLMAGWLGIRNSVQASPQAPGSWDWPTSTPEKEGLDAGKLAQLADLIREGIRYPRLHALLIVRHGQLIFEEYFNSWKGDRLHTLQSVTKSFTSALIGIAIARGEFKGVDEKVLNFSPDVKEIAYRDQSKESIRLQDLLTMRSGTDFHEKGQGSPLEQLSRLETGWDRFYLDRPMLRPPGTSFLYDSGGVILLSAILKRRTGMHADVYADQFLFKPLGIVNKFWMKNREGHAHAGGGLCLTARDAAKFGLLYLRKGKWGNDQVVPEEWVRESFRQYVEFPASGPKGPGAVGYGYLWWVLFPDPQGDGRHNIYAAMGRSGQYIFVIPEYDMVAVVFGDTKSMVDQNKPIEFLYSHILPAVRREEMRPPSMKKMPADGQRAVESRF